MKFTRQQRTGVVVLLGLLCLATVLPISTPGSNANAPYSERLTIFDLRGSYFWELNFTGGNIALPFGITPPPGVTYTITEVHYTSWQPEYYIFGSKGFNFLFGLQSPPSGVTVTINSPPGQSVANSFITSLSSGFHLNFLQVSTSGTNFTYYSNLNVTSSLFPLFWKVTSSLPKGLINLTSQTSIVSAPFSVISFSGTSLGNSVYLESLSPGISNPNQFSLTSLFSNEKSVNVSTSATFSSVQLNVVGGLITNSTGGTVVNSTSTTQASLTNTNPTPGKPLPDINATIDTNFASLLITRDISNATPVIGNNIIVTLEISNIGNVAATGISINDSWWRVGNELSLVAPTKSTISIPSLAPGKTQPLVYNLSVSNGNTPVTAPATPIPYTFSVGKVNLTRVAFINPFTVFPNAPSPQPVIVTLVSANSSSTGVGDNSLVRLTVWNRGNEPVSGLFLKNQPSATFPSGSGGPQSNAIVNASVYSGIITEANKSITFTVGWTAPGGTSNSSSVEMDYTYSAPAIPSLSIIKSITKRVAGTSVLVNVSLSITNTGLTTVTRVNVSDSFSKFPSGALLLATKGNFTGSIGQTVTATISSIGASQTKLLWYTLNATNTSENYIFLPAGYSAPSFLGSAYTGNSTAAELALGVKVTKFLSYAVGFLTQNATEVITANNVGTSAIYGVNLTALGDGFLKVTTSQKYAYFDTLSPSQNFSAKFEVTFSSSGVFNSTGGRASFQFGGTDNLGTSNATPVLIWSLPSVTLTPSTNSPVETHSFTITMSITNPSNLTISNVKVVFHLPKYLQYVGGPTFNQSLSTFTGNETQKFTMTVKSNSPYQYNITSPVMTFQYAGETLHGTSNSLFLSVGDDIPIRYGIPIGIAILFVLLTFVGIRRVLPKRGEAVPRR